MPTSNLLRQARPSEPTAPADHIPSIVVWMLLLFAVKSSLHFLGFQRTIRILRATAGRAPLLPLTDHTVVTAAADAISMAAAVFPGRALCLEQSLALYLWLRRRGAPVALRLGVQACPFQAHAWVEYEGEPVNEDREWLKRFTLMPSMLS